MSVTIMDILEKAMVCMILLWWIFNDETEE